jgi:Tfp pilus assembly protein PilF
MNSLKGRPTSAGPKSPQAATAVARGQERFKLAIEEVRRGHKDLARKALAAAIDAFSEAIRVDPGHAAAYLLRARAYEEQGDDAKAEADLVQARTFDRG